MRDTIELKLKTVDATTFLVVMALMIYGMIAGIILTNTANTVEQQQAQQSCVCQETEDFDLNTMMRSYE